MLVGRSANELIWRPQTALFVNERSLVAALLPPVPAATVLDRFLTAFVRVSSCRRRLRILDAELEPMQTHTLPTPSVAGCSA